MEMRSPSSPSSIGIGEQPSEAKMIAGPVISWIKSHQVFIQALLVWGILCLPGNIVTLILYDQVNSIPRQDNTSELMINQTVEMSSNNSSLSSNTGVTMPAFTTYQQSFDCSDFWMKSNLSHFIESQAELQCANVTNIENCILALIETHAAALMQHCQFEVSQLQGMIDRNYTCHEPLSNPLMDIAQFWLEGVAILVVGTFGLMGNLMTLLVLRRIDSNVMFNKLLMSLAIFDSLYLVYYVVDYGIIGTFMRAKDNMVEEEKSEPYWYRVTYPFLLWPLKWMFMSCTIFMVVAISAERHRAICSPLTHRPKFWPYIFMVIFSACTFNIPKYFEFQWKDNEDDYDTTALNENRTYIVFCSWWNDLTVFGIIPFVALVVFNLKIYFKVRSSDKLEYRFVGRKANSTRSTLETHVRDISLRSYSSSGNGKITKANDIELMDMTPQTILETDKTFEAENQANFEGRTVSLKHHRHRPNPNRQSKLLQRRFSEIELDKSFRQESIREHPPVHFQKRREKSARVLITIVLTFLFCHTFRFVLKFYEVTHPSHSTPEHHNHCHEQERFHVPVVMYVLLSLHNLLLVVNSSVNFIIYCCVGKRFRQELKLMLTPYCNFVCRCVCNDQKDQADAEDPVPCQF